jgi:hypothetical protein
LNDKTKLVAGSGAKPTAPSNQFIVKVADNFPCQDESETCTKGTFATYAAAVLACADIVHESLLNLAKPGISGAELYDEYKDFGEDPYVVGAGPGNQPFNARTYAKYLCETWPDPESILE